MKIRRRRVIRIFPNEEACLRLICALCIEQNEEWLTGRRYMKFVVFLWSLFIRDKMRSLRLSRKRGW